MDGAVVYALLVSTLTALVSCHQVCFIGSEYDPRSGKPSRWFLPYKDPCKCTAIRLGGMNIPASSYLQGAPYYLDGLFLTEDPEEIQRVFGCPTVNEEEPTADDQITKKQSAEERTTEERTTEERTTEEPTTKETTNEEPTTKEPTTEEPTTDEPTTKEPATEEPTTEEPTTELPTTEESTTEETTEEPTTEEPTTEEPTTEEPSTEDNIVWLLTMNCSNPTPLGLENHTIPDDRMTASSAKSGHPASDARLNNHGYHWCPETYEGSWIEVDLVEPTVVTGVVTQGDGRKHAKQYKVSHKKMGSSEYEYVTDVDGSIKEFDGIQNGTDTVKNMFHRIIVTTAVRIEPTVWDKEPRMRLELLGCRYQ